MKYFITSKISENIHETPEGYLVCVGVPIARPGTMLYAADELPLDPDDDGKITISREADQLFDPRTIASFEGKPITITHPKDFVNPNNWATLSKGTMQNVRRGEGEYENDLVADLMITDGMAIALVKNGLREVSCGYEATYYQDGPGRAHQEKIIGNHLALVQKGRAGVDYAINDHEGVPSMSKKLTLKERVAAIFAKAQDEAMKVADEASDKEDDKKDKDTTDEEMPVQNKSMDELVAAVKDLAGQVASMGKKDAPAKKEGAKKEEAGDEDAEASLEERLKILEASVQKLLEREAKEDEVEVDAEEMEETGDEDTEDDDFEETTMTGDAATEIVSRAEILAPGIKGGKDVKARALKAAYQTADGKKVIDKLTGGKAPTFDSAEKVDTLFVAASELMKVTRAGDLSKTKQTRDYQSVIGDNGAMTAEKLNEINAKHYKKA